ncbi:hypothetical protein X801_02151, partial [Opisthorchis viverrini]
NKAVMAGNGAPPVQLQYELDFKDGYRRTSSKDQKQTSGPVGFDDMPGPAPPYAPYPTEAPPPYDEATHTPFSAFTEDSTTRQRPTSSSSSDYGWRRDFAPNRSGPRSYHPKEHTQSGSWLSNSLAAGAGFLGGYFLGSRDRAPMHHTSQSRLYPDLGGVGDETTYDSHTATTTTRTSSPRSNEDDRDSYVATEWVELLARMTCIKFQLGLR